MQQASNIRERTRSELIADALGDTVAELRLIDAADLVGYIKHAQWANIADLVQSSAELSFKDGVLTFACAADVEMNWGDPPLLSLDLEFQHDGITAFFALFLGAGDSKVAVKAVWFDTPPCDQTEGTRALARALHAARRGAGGP